MREQPHTVCMDMLSTSASLDVKQAVTSSGIMEHIIDSAVGAPLPLSDTTAEFFYGFPTLDARKFHKVLIAFLTYHAYRKTQFIAFDERQRTTSGVLIASDLFTG